MVGLDCHQGSSSFHGCSIWGAVSGVSDDGVLLFTFLLEARGHLVSWDE